MFLKFTFDWEFYILTDNPILKLNKLQAGRRTLRGTNTQ